VNILFGVYEGQTEDQTLKALFELESEAKKCCEYLNYINKSEYSKFYIQEEWFYTSYEDYLIDVKSGG